MQALTELIEIHPAHAVVFRSLNEYSNSDLIGQLTRHGFMLIPSRQVYILEKDPQQAIKHHNTRMDFKLLNTTPYVKCTDKSIIAEHLHRIVELYTQLYIEKYSEHNPQFTVEFMRYALESDLFDLEIFIDPEGRVDAVGGRFIVDGTVTLPIVGYDRARPRSYGLYRLILASTQKYALDRGLTFNVSSGAAEFKRYRGAKAYIEYSAVYVNHLSRSRRYLWLLLQKLLFRFFVPLMQKYEL